MPLVLEIVRQEHGGHTTLAELTLEPPGGAQCLLELVAKVPGPWGKRRGNVAVEPTVRQALTRVVPIRAEGRPRTGEMLTQLRSAASFRASRDESLGL